MRISTGLILCAGFGKRVAPLTNTTPKPLLKIKNSTLLENSINFLKKCGIDKIMINTHYLSDEIENFIEKKKYKNEVKIFFEKEILDTGGGIKNLVNNDTDEDFLVINPDTIWKDNYLIEVEKMKKFYFDNNLSNILMLVKKSKSFDKRFKGDFTLMDNLVTKEHINNYIFTGCQILNKNIFIGINKDKFSISEVWEKEIKNKQLYGTESINEFFHVTDLEIYKKLSS
ncbi:sugar phosphate nucleotidyltransferase [Candidatus Pelagibacter sp.]|nr:sugar phosphate nucleotidyltransferase [Candidatus Pelagibacter sp.]